MRSIVLVLVLLFTSVIARAETMEIRPSAPVAEFAIPDSWTTTRTDRGIQAVSEDKEVYFWIEAYKPDEFKQILAEHDAYWKDQGVVINSREADTHEENGQKVIMTTEHATWKDAPTVLYYVEYQLNLPSQSNIVLTYWASPEGDKQYQHEVGDVLGSLKVTEEK